MTRPAMSALAPLPLQRPSPDPRAAARKLQDSHAHLLKSSLYAKWQAANPNEAAACETYWSNPAAYPAVKTEFGMSYRDEIEAFHYTAGSHL